MFDSFCCRCRIIIILYVLIFNSILIFVSYRNNNNKNKCRVEKFIEILDGPPFSLSLFILAYSSLFTDRDTILWIRFTIFSRLFAVCLPENSAKNNSKKLWTHRILFESKVCIILMFKCVFLTFSFYLSPVFVWYHFAKKEILIETKTKTWLKMRIKLMMMDQIQILHPFQERGRVTQNPIMSSISLVYFISSILLSLLFGLLQFDSLFLSFSLYFIIIIIICNSR